MLDPEITQKISDAGSPLVFTQDPNNASAKALTKFKIDGGEKNIRSTAFAEGKLVITLASFTPTVTPTGQTNLAWDKAATEFTVVVDNPSTDYPDQWLTEVTAIEQTAGAVSVDLDDYTPTTQQTLPLTASGDFTVKYTADKTVSYIRPVHASVNGTANGGSAGANVVLKSKTGTADAVNWTTKYPWSTTWQNVSHSISLANLTGKTFLKTYDKVTFTVASSGLDTRGNANHTFTVTGGTATEPGTSGSLTGDFEFDKEINHSNGATVRTIRLTTEFTRPAEVTGTEYKFTPGDETTTAISAAFSYPSFTLMSASTPTANTIISDGSTTGFSGAVALLGDQQKAYTTSVTNPDATNATKFWFGVRTAAGVPTSIKGGTSLISDVSYETATITLTPSNTSDADKWQNYSGEGYTLIGITIPGGASTNIIIS